MKKTMIPALASAACLLAIGCTNRERVREERGSAQSTMERHWETRGSTADALDGVLTYQVSRLDADSQEVVLVPADIAESDIEPQAGEELRLTFEEIRAIAERSDLEGEDVLDSLQEGVEVIVHADRLGFPTSAQDIERIELPE